jgi:hypothetical protein
VGVPRFENGAFYFDAENIAMKNLAYEGTTVSDLAARVAKSRLLPGKARAMIGDKAQQAEDWAASLAQEAVKEALASHPVYRVGDDTKGAIIKASLNSVRVVNDHIEASFSLWRLTTSVIAGACGLVMAVMLAALMLKYANSDDVSASIIPDP